MATWTVYTTKANPANATNPGTLATSPVSTGITYDDAAAGRPFPAVGDFLNFLQRNDHDGLKYSGSADAGATFTQSSDKGAY